MQLVLNAGGPDRISRVQMAEAVAKVRGYNTSFIKSVSASSVSKFTLMYIVFRRFEANSKTCKFKTDAAHSLLPLSSAYRLPLSLP